MKAKIEKANTENTKNEQFGANELVFLPLERIGKHPKLAYRKADDAHVEFLRNSILQEGLKMPLTVWNGGETDDQMKLKAGVFPASWLVAGVHRLAAMQRIYKEDPAKFKKVFPDGIPCKVEGGEFKGAVLTQLIENVTRKEMSMQEVLPLVISLRDDHKMKGSEIAKRIGKSPSWVSEVLSVNDNVPAEVLDDMTKGGVTMQQAVATSKELKKAKDAGVAVDAKAVVEKVKTAAEEKPKRVKVELIWKRYGALPQLDDKTKLNILERTMRYLVGELANLPKELQKD